MQQKAITLRKANWSDVGFYLLLRNDITVRNSSFNKNLVDFGVHNNWFKNKLRDSSSFLYVVETVHKRAGQIRFDIENNQAEVHISILPEFRGRGTAVLALKKACRLIFSKNPGTNLITAHIKLNNSASRKSFLNAGFKEANLKLIHHNRCIEMVLER